MTTNIFKNIQCNECKNQIKEGEMMEVVYIDRRRGKFGTVITSEITQYLRYGEYKTLYYCEKCAVELAD